MYPIENDIVEKIESFTENLLNGNIKDFYPDIVINYEMPDGYNMNGDGIIIPKSIFLNKTLLHKKKAFLSQYNNVLGYSDKELLATYYYYVLCHKATHKARDNDGYDLTNPQEFYHLPFSEGDFIATRFYSATKSFAPTLHYSNSTHFQNKTQE